MIFEAVLCCAFFRSGYNRIQIKSRAGKQVHLLENKRTKILLWALTAAVLGGTVWALYATGFFQAASDPEALGEYNINLLIR